MPTILETTIVALTVQVGSRDINSICHETGLRSADVKAVALPGGHPDFDRDLTGGDFV